MRNVGRCLQSVGRSLYPPSPCFPLPACCVVDPYALSGCHGQQSLDPIPCNATRDPCMCPCFLPPSLWDLDVPYHTYNSHKVFGCIHHRRSTICWPTCLLFRKIRDAQRSKCGPNQPSQVPVARHHRAGTSPCQ